VDVWIGNASGFCVKKDEKYYPGNGLQLYCWDGKNEVGEQVSSGIYFYLVASEGKVLRKNKFAVVR
jgi:flagellar hook assembly protein FlgD